MQQHVQCITLRVVKYSDTASMATLWSRQLGRISAAIPSGSGREAARRRAIMMPFQPFEAVVTMRPGSDVARLRDLAPLAPAALPDPAAGTVALFLADFLSVVLRDAPADAQLSDFIFEQAVLLPALRGRALANFHISFLYRLTHFLGIEPDMGTYAPGAWLDMRGGRFTLAKPMHQQALAPECAALAHTLSRLGPRSLHLLRLGREQRSAALDALLAYYELHLAPLSSLRSLPILRALFSP